MRCLVPLVGLLVACSDETQPVADVAPVESRVLATGISPYATQTDAPAPDYAVLNAVPSSEGEGSVRRDRTAPLPDDARAVGDAWITRLEDRNALLGYGSARKGPDGPVDMIDVGMTATDFDAWVAEEGWAVPGHIEWSFQPALNLPRVTDAAREGIRVWPASTARTGAQLEALLSGKVELRDGCFWNGGKLAFFHAEIGLDKDQQGHFVLTDRVTGRVRARLGETMVWGGPPSAYIGARAEAELRAACGDAEIEVVGSPESEERASTARPHTRNPAPPPLPPAN